MNLLNEIWKFSINPQLKPFNKTSVSFGGFFKTLLIFYGVAFVSAIPIIIIVKLIEKINGINLNEIRNNHFLNINHGFYIIIVMVFLGPLIEETICRLWLSFKKPHIIISLITIIWILTTKFQGIIIYNQVFDYHFFKNLFFAIFLGFVGFYIFQIIAPQKKISPNYFKILYWFSCTGFGLIHILNFTPIKINIIWVYPFLVLPQLIMGYFLGYLRLRKGFWVGVVFHGLANLVPALIYFFAQK
ncbi:MAG: CPBP family glutamic-type intramembrane protease [Pelobium sp.]